MTGDADRAPQKGKVSVMFTRSKAGLTSAALALGALGLTAARPAVAAVSVKDGNFTSAGSKFSPSGSTIENDGSGGAFNNDGWYGVAGTNEQSYSVGVHNVNNNAAYSYSAYVNTGYIYQDLGTIIGTGDIIAINGSFATDGQATGGYTEELLDFSGGTPTSTVLASYTSSAITANENTFAALNTLTFSNTTAGQDIGLELINTHSNGYSTQTDFTGISATDTPASASPAPEPSQVGVMVLIGVGLGGLMLRARKARAGAA